MPQYAQIAVNTPVHKTFHYHVPPALMGQVQPGHLVRVSFGVAMQPGIVLDLLDDSPITETKPIIELLDPEPVMTEMHLRLGMWLSEAYLAPPGYCLWLMLPPGITGSSTRRVTLLDRSASPSDSLQAHIITQLSQHSDQSLLEKDLKRHTKASQRDLRAALHTLETAGMVRVQSILTTPAVKPATVRTVTLAVPAAILPDVIASESRLGSRQLAVLEYLAAQPGTLDASQVYDATGANSSVLNSLEDRGLIHQGERLSYRDSLADYDFVPSKPPVLVPAQQQVRDTIQAAFDHPDPAQRFFLLHGVTGSGKTEIYLQAIAQTLKQGRQAIFLVPEIALTPQTIRRVSERFPDQVALVHGSLTPRERYDTWSRARQGDVGVIVGTRSALFTPLPDVGLVILDEEHDHSYKHAPPFNPPFYHARRVAEKMMRLNQGVLILGSATPGLETRYRAERGDLRYLNLPGRIMGHKKRVESQSARAGVTTKYVPAGDDALMIDLPPVLVVDMRDELKAGNRTMFSRVLRDEINGVLAREEQAILFLNRRGQATYVFCRDCGYVMTCDRCDMPLTYHRQGENLQCHHCGNQQPDTQTCPDCGSKRIKYFGAGTQQVEQAVHQMFPQARTLRWDADTAAKPEAHESILSQFSHQEADILIGTQMIAKGLDLPLVTLVGVVNADPGLTLPDFRAMERTFQLLTQVAGRAGRGILGGQVILQTYQPDHESIVCAAEHDYSRFYESAIAARRETGYPPFRRLARLLIQNTHPYQAQHEAEKLASTLRRQIERRDLTDIALIGPVPCFFSRIDKQYRWQIIVRAVNPLPALRDLRLKPGIALDIDPVDIL